MTTFLIILIVSIIILAGIIIYNLLWQNTKTNVSVYLTPANGAGAGRDLWITNVNNPYPYQRDTYEKLKKL